MTELELQSEEEQPIGGKTIDEWEQEWVPLEGGFKATHSELRDKVGLYRAVLDGKVVVLGKATEWRNGGLRKRLSDFKRRSRSASSHRAGTFIREHIDDLKAEVLVTGTDGDAAELANKLVGPMKKLHKPSENVSDERIKAMIAENYRKK